MPSENPINNETVVEQPMASSNYMTPAAIIVAGLIIAGTVLMTNSPNSASNQGNPNTDPADTMSASERILALADDIGLDGEEIVACAEEGRYDSEVQADIDNAILTGGQGTPWSVIVRSDGTKIPVGGALPAASLNNFLTADPATLSLDPQKLAQIENVAPVTEADYRVGPANAETVIIEYSDYDCPFCRSFHSTLQTVVDNNDSVAWVYRHFPLESLHPNARLVANAAECIGQLEGEEAFWKFTDSYFAS